MATQTLSTADAILKDLYVGPIVEMINNKTYLIDQIERDSDHIEHTGRRAIVPLHTARNRGRGSIADGGTLPAAGKQVWQDAIVNIRYHTYGIELTDQAIEATKSSDGAFVRLLEAESKGVAQDMRKDINRQAFGDGTGLLGTCASNAAGVITMGNSTDVQYIQIGDVVDVLVKSSGATTNGVVGTTVTARSTSTPSITVSPAPAGAVGSTYGVYVSGNRNNEMDGLRNGAGTTSRLLHSIDSTTAGNEFWNPQVVNVGSSASATAVAGESSFEQLADQIGGVGNGEVEVFLTSRGVRRRLADTYQSQKRFNDAKATEVHGGYTAIMVNEVPVIADDDAPKTWVFALNKDALKWFEQTPPDFLTSKDGTVFHLKPGSTAGTFSSVWQAWFRWYAALGFVAPNRLGALKFATDDTTT